MTRWLLVAALLLAVLVVVGILLRGEGSDGGLSAETERAADGTEPARLEGRVDPKPVAPSTTPTPADAAPATNPAPPPAEAGARLEGLVLAAADGAPVAGAEVRATSGGDTSSGIVLSGDEPLGSATTDADGRFVFASLPAGEVCTLHVRAAGFAAASVGLLVPNPPAEAQPVEIRLEAGGRILGRVLDPDGIPVPGATVLLDFDADLGAVADAEGRYAIEDLAFGTLYEVEARAPGFASSEDVEDLLLDEASPLLEIDLHLRRAATLLVYVVDERGGAIPEIEEAGLGPYPFAGWAGETDPDAPGLVRFVDVDPGRQRLQISAPGYVNHDRMVQVPEGVTTEMTVRLGRGLAIEGVVVDDRGLPVPGADVSASLRGRHGAEAKTDDAGSFRLTGLRARPHSVWANAEGHSAAARAEATPPASDVRLVLIRSARVRFRLRMPEGATPPEEVTVSAARSGGASGTGARWRDDAYELSFEPGPFTFGVEGPGFACWTKALDPQPGEVIDLGTIQLDEGIALELHARDPAGEPVAGAAINIVRPLALWRLGEPDVTDVRGRARLRHLSPGSYRLDIEAEGFLERVVELAVSASLPPVDLVLYRGGLLGGRVVDAGGRPLVDRSVVLHEVAADGTLRPDCSDSTDQGGRFGRRVEPGTYRVVVEIAEGREVTSEEVVVEEGGTYDVGFRVTE